MRIVSKQRYSTVGDGLCLSFIFRLCKFFVEVVDIYETIFVETKSRFGFQDSSNGFINARRSNTAGLYGLFERGHGGIRNWKLEQYVCAGFDCAYGGIAWSELRGHPAHVHGVGDDEAFEFQFIA